MSLTDKEKEIAFSHAKDWIEEGTTDEQLLMFVDLFLSRIPPRALRILGTAGAEDYVEINKPDPMTGQALNDLTRGKYDVTVTVGPSFATQRQEAAEIYMGLAQAQPGVMQVAGDLIFRSLDLPYADDIETIPADEADDIQRVIDALELILARRQAKSGQFRADVHVKTHGYAQGELRVLPNLPDELAQGLFGHDGVYSAVVRFSNAASQLRAPAPLLLAWTPHNPRWTRDKSLW